MSEEEMTMLKIKSLVYIITFYQLIDKKDDYAVFNQKEILVISSSFFDSTL